MFERPVVGDEVESPAEVSGKGNRTRKEKIN